MKKAERKDPGVDQSVTVEAIDQPPDRDDSLTDYIDPNQLDAPYVAPGVLSDNLQPADLTRTVNGLWPGNPPNRTGNFYFDLNRLALEPGQIGLLGSLCENFVFERVDVHMISEADSEICLEVLADYPEEPVSLDSFLVPGQCRQVSRGKNGEALQAEKVQAGTFMGRKRAWLKFHNELPKQGRIVINFVGYLIEPWR